MNTSLSEYWPLPILTDILFRSSNGGEFCELVRYSMVSKNFAEAVKGVRCLRLVYLKIIWRPPKEHASVLAHVVRLTPNIEELALDETFDPSMEMIGSCFLHWSVVIGSQLTTFNATRCKFTASHLNALSEMKALTRLVFQDCKITSKKGINKMLFENVEELLLIKNFGGCTHEESLNSLLGHMPRLRVLCCKGYGGARYPLDINSKSLEVLTITSCAKLLVNTPNLRELHLNASLLGISTHKMTHLIKLSLKWPPYPMRGFSIIRRLLEDCPSLKEVELKFWPEKVDPIASIRYVTEVAKLQSLYSYIEFTLPWDSCLNYHSK